MGSGTASANWGKTMWGFWVHRLKRGQVPEPERAYVPVEEKYCIVAPENSLREFFGRYRCPACGKAFFLLKSAWDCHPKASAYRVWIKYAYRGQTGERSLEDVIRAGSSYGSYGGGPYGL